MFANDKSDSFMPYCPSPCTFHKRKKKEKEIGREWTVNSDNKLTLD